MGQAYRTPKEASAQTNSCRLAPLGGQISLGGVVDSQAASTRDQDKRQHLLARSFFGSSQRFSCVPPASGWCRSSETLAYCSTCVPLASGCCRSSETLASWPSCVPPASGCCRSSETMASWPSCVPPASGYCRSSGTMDSWPSCVHQPLDVAMASPVSCSALQVGRSIPPETLPAVPSSIHTLPWVLEPHRQAPAGADLRFFYIRVETVRSLLPEAIPRLQSRSGPLCALAYPRCLVHIQRQGSSSTGVYRVRGAVEGSSVDGRRCRMSLPFSASPPRPCILSRTEKVLGGPGIPRAVPREPHHWCPAPFSERRWGESRQKGEFPPFVGSFCIVRGRFHRFSLPLGIPACPNISPRRPRVEYCFLLAWFLPWIYMFLVDVLVCSYLSNWMFPSAPTHMDVLVCSYLSNWMFSIHSHARLLPCRRALPSRGGVPEELPQNPCLNGVVQTWAAPPVSIALSCAFEALRRKQEAPPDLESPAGHLRGPIYLVHSPSLFVYVGAPFGVRSVWSVRAPCLSTWGLFWGPICLVRSHSLFVYVEASFWVRSTWCIRPPLSLRGSLFWGPIYLVRSHSLFVYVGASRRSCQLFVCVGTFVDLGYALAGEWGLPLEASMGVFSLFAPEPWVGISDVARFSARRCCCWELSRALGGLQGGVLIFCAFFSLGISDVARFSARRCCCWGPPRALGGLHGDVHTFAPFFPWVYRMSPVSLQGGVAVGS